jgi:hypothetical protein
VYKLQWRRANAGHWGCIEATQITDAETRFTGWGCEGRIGSVLVEFFIPHPRDDPEAAEAKWQWPLERSSAPADYIMTADFSPVGRSTGTEVAARGPLGSGLYLLIIFAATVYQLLGSVFFNDWPWHGWGPRAVVAAACIPMFLVGARYAWKENNRWSLEALAYMGGALLTFFVAVFSLMFWVRDQQ